ncbi:MAG: DUF3467 domain-containing protein [Ardenticatenia bacterium]|nr:DUF3467 domain-containing protein [Ardenticatenia bacterium]
MQSQQPPEGNDRQPPAFQVAIRLEWADDETLPVVYANQVQVAHGGPEFFITFGLLRPPTNPNDLPDVIHIRPQARIAIARDVMPSIIQTLNDNLQRYQELMRQRTAGDGPLAEG